MKKKFQSRTMCCRLLEKQKIWTEMMLQSSRKKARKKELLQRRRLQQRRKLRKRMMTKKKKKKKVKLCFFFWRRKNFFQFCSKDYDDEDDVPVRTKKSAAKAVSVKREAVLDLVQDSPKKSEQICLFKNCFFFFSVTVAKTTKKAVPSPKIGFLLFGYFVVGFETKNRGRVQKECCKCVSAFRRFGLEQAARFQKEKVKNAVLKNQMQCFSIGILLFQSWHVVVFVSSKISSSSLLRHHALQRL
jgi:hypothetical protein